MTDKNKKWIDAKKKFRLSDTHIQMARELGMNPKKFGSLANHKQEQWKAPLPEFMGPFAEVDVFTSLIQNSIGTLTILLA